MALGIYASVILGGEAFVLIGTHSSYLIHWIYALVVNIMLQMLILPSLPDSVCVYGQGCRQKQLDGINSGAQVVVATPGRLDDLVRQKEVDLSRVSYVVFDEADRMLDMGFMSNLTLIISKVRDDKQFIMTRWVGGQAVYHDQVQNITRHVIYFSSGILACNRFYEISQCMSFTVH